jgi:hypothetical protein
MVPGKDSTRADDAQPAMRGCTVKCVTGYLQ